MKTEVPNVPQGHYAQATQNQVYPVNLSEKITADNVQRMGEMFALRAFKPFLRYADPAFGGLYKGLIRDINRPNDISHTLSDGYDIAQTAICFLCEHIGKTLNDVLGTDRRGKVLTVKLACFRTVNRSLNKLFSNTRRSVCIENVYEPKTATQFDFDATETVTKEDFTAVDETIAKLELTDKQKNALLCLMNEPSYSEVARQLSRNVGTIWVTISRIREKYIKLFGTPKLRTSF